MNNLKNTNTVTLSNNLRLPRTPCGGAGEPLTLPAFIVMVDAAGLVVPLSLPLGILRHIKQFQVTFQQTEAGSLYTMELPVLNEYATSDTSKRPDKSDTWGNHIWGYTLA